MQIPTNIPRRIAALLLFAALGIAIVTTAQQEGSASGSPKKRSDDALQQAVVADMSAKELRAYTRQIAAKDPMHAVGFFLEVMALDLDKAPSFDNRRILIAEASRRQPSFAAPRIWLTADDIRNARYGQAIGGADTVMRLNGEFRTLLVPILAPLLINEKAYPILEKKLSSFPSWRTEFLSEAIKSGAYNDRVEQLLQQDAPPRYAEAMATERSSYLKKLVADNEAVRAHTVWQSFVPKTKNAAIFDGDFKSQFPVAPFAWLYASDDYSYAEKIKTAENSEVLVRAHHGSDGRVVLLTQLVSMKPGANRFAVTLRDGGLEKPEAFFWRVRCLGSETNIVSQPVGNLGGDWQTLQVPVTIPEAGCALQYLSLVADDNDGNEAEIEIRKVEAR